MIVSPPLASASPVAPRWHLALRSLFRGTPVWAFRAGMYFIQSSEVKRMNVDPIVGVRATNDIDYAAGRGIGSHAQQRLDVLVPEHPGRPGHPGRPDQAEHREPPGGTPLPVYVYFHGGGWTSGD